MILMIIIMLFGAADRLDQARAQASTRLYFESSFDNVPLGNTTQIDLKIGNGVDINAFEIELQYDSSVILLESWSEGGYLSNLAYFVREEEPGRLHLAAAQLARPGVSGDGILITLVFSTVSVGASELILQQADLALSGGGMLQPAVENGWVDVVPVLAPTATFTRTVIPSSTLTPKPSATSTLVRTSVPTRTLTPAMALSPTLANPSETGTGKVMSPLVTAMVPRLTTTSGSSALPGSPFTATPPSTGLLQQSATTDGSMSVSDRLTPTLAVSGQMDEKTIAMVNTLLWLVLAGLAFLLIVFILRFVIRKKKV